MKIENIIQIEWCCLLRWLRCTGDQCYKNVCYRVKWATV